MKRILLHETLRPCKSLYKKALKYCQDDKEVMQNEIDVLKEQLQQAQDEIEANIRQMNEYHQETRRLASELARIKAPEYPFADDVIAERDALKIILLDDFGFTEAGLEKTIAQIRKQIGGE